jgi:hypothetical protein
MASSRTKADHQHDGGDGGGAGVVELLEPDDDQQRRDLGDEGHVAGDEDDRAVFTHGAREGEREAGEHGGSRAGSMTRPTVCSRRPPASPRLLELAVEIGSSTGCTVRTTKGRPMKVSATTMPAGV